MSKSAPRTSIRSDYRCAACGCGAVTEAPPHLCPTCGSQTWDHTPWRPFTTGGDAFFDRLAAPPARDAMRAV